MAHPRKVSSHLSRLFPADASSPTPASSFIRNGVEIPLVVGICPFTAEKIATSPVNAIGSIRTPATPADNLQFRLRNAARGTACRTDLIDVYRVSLASGGSARPPDPPFRFPRSRARPAAPSSNGETSSALSCIANLVRPCVCPASMPPSTTGVTVVSHVTRFPRNITSRLHVCTLFGASPLFWCGVSWLKSRAPSRF